VQLLEQLGRALDLASGKSMCSASISSNPSTCVRLRRATRSRALSSISRDTSMPVMRTSRG
jgi:hypothetical protein